LLISISEIKYSYQELGTVELVVVDAWIEIAKDLPFEQCPITYSETREKQQPQEFVARFIHKEKSASNGRTQLLSKRIRSIALLPR
jgi:hypothetical protein